jgi:hypothetical protein
MKGRPAGRPYLQRTTWLIAVLLALLGVQPSAALVVYRIGGEGLPPPAEVEAGAEFRQLSWADLDKNLGGQSFGLALSEQITPFFYNEGDNMATTLSGVSGNFQHGAYNGFEDVGDELKLVIDGDPATFFLETRPREHAHNFHGTALFFDLGGDFATRLVRFIPQAGSERSVAHVIVAAQTEAGGGVDEIEFVGTSALGRSLDPKQQKGIELKVVAEILENKDPQLDIELDGTPIRYLMIHVMPQNEIWDLAELEVYGGGFQGSASHQSNVLDLGEFANLGWVRWGGRRDEGAQVEIRSRVGGDETPLVYWRKTFRGDEQVPFGEDGKLLTRKSYSRLGPIVRGAITDDTAQWELWSSPYEFADSAGVALRATRSHRYVQFGIAFKSFGQAGGQLDYLEFAVSPRLVTALVGEVDPWQAAVAEERTFTYALRPTIEPGDQGFDGLDLSLVGGRIVGVEAVRLSGAPVADFSAVAEVAGVMLGFPRLDVARSGELLEVDVRAEIFRFGAIFEGRVIDSTAPGEIGQLVAAGEASELVDGNQLSVQAMTLNDRVLGAVSLSAAAFTPNGDQINDQVEIAYELLKVTEPVSVEVLVRDLSGRLVRRVYSDADGAGRHPRQWDGRDEAGQQVAPGLYICQVEVESGGQRQVQMRPIAVAY